MPRFATVLTALCFTFSLFHPGSLSAQSGTGSIGGTVTDPSGALVPDVAFLVRNQLNGLTRTTISSHSGAYRVGQLQPGTYEIRATAPGFKRAVATGVEVTVGQAVSLDLQLELGGPDQTATVVVERQTPATEDSQISSLVDSRRVVDLPLNGRNIYVLASLQPGLVPAMLSIRQSGGPNSSSFFAAGSRFRGNQFNLDGGHNTFDGVSGFPVLQPSVEVVQEFRLIRNNYSAEFGTHSASVVEVATKAGNNQFGGSIYAFHRNDAVDAAGIFAEIDPATGEKEKAPLKQNQFGFTLGGPLVRNRLFFFASYEGQRRHFGTVESFSVETPEFRRYVIENFPDGTAAQIFRLAPATAPTSDILTVEDILSTPGPPPCFFCGGIPFPPDLPVRGRARTGATQKDNWDQFSIRLDSTFNDDRTQLFGRYALHDGTLTAPFDQRPAFVNLNDDTNQHLTFSLIQVFTPTLLNTGRFTYVYSRTDNTTSNPHVPHTLLTGSTAGLDLLDNIGGSFAFPQLFTHETFQWQDLVSFSAGSHFLRAGVDVRRTTEDGDFATNSRPLVIYRGLFDFALDAPYFYSAGINPQTGGLTSTPRKFQSTEVGWFVQDDWKVHPRLTLNLGLRWDYFGPISEASGRLSNIGLPGGSGYFERIQNASVGPVESLYRSDLNNFAPRLGFAWDVFGDDTTALRGGYGVSYDKIFFNIVANSRFNPPFFGIALLSNLFFGDDLSNLPLIGDDPNDLFGGFLGRVVSNPLGFDERGGIIGQRLGLRVIDPNIRDSYVHNVFLGLQRRLPWGMLWEANYQGTFGRKLPFIGDPNRFDGDLLGAPDPFGGAEGDSGLNLINPSFGSFNLRQNRISSNYHGLNLQLSKDFSDSFTFQISYTLGKSLDYNSDVAGEGRNGGGSHLYFTDPLNAGLDYGRSNFDIRQRMVANLIWEIPSARTRSKLLNNIFGGWQTSAIFPIQTGLPFSVTSGATFFGGGDFNADGKAGDRPDTPTFGNHLARSPGTREFTAGIFAPEDFPLPPPGENGDLGRNTFTGPAFWTLDLVLFRDFPLPIRDAMKIQFRAEFFNLFNRVNLFLPIADLDNGGFGRSTAAFSPREIQFGLKVIF